MVYVEVVARRQVVGQFHVFPRGDQRDPWRIHRASNDQGGIRPDVPAVRHRHVYGSCPVEVASDGDRRGIIEE